MPIVTLSTDTGLHDYLAGAIKGQLLSANSDLNIVDITHALSLDDYPHAAYICNNAYKYFPEGTYHLLLINLFEKSPTRFLITQYNNQFIICPDNGILTMITGSKPDNVIAVKLEETKQTKTLTFTAAIAGTLAKLLMGKKLEETGSYVDDIVEKYPLRSTTGLNWLEGQIIFIDKFENVVVNITRKEFEELRNGRKFHISFMRNEVISNLSENYASVQPGEKLAWFNSADYLEISVNKGNMAGLFGLSSFTPGTNLPQHKWFYQTVRIYFE